MSGFVKAKKYDWNDTNLSLFGSDTDKKVKKESAMTEPAWKGAGHCVGLQIWRIVKFKVCNWSKEEYGKFYDGDSYIILNTYKEKDCESLLYDLHFWIGKYSTQDEYGTAAYKTVELDNLLDDKPIQHREVMDHESTLFKTYFKSLTLMEGGAETGFKHVKPTEYVPRLLRVHGTKKNITVKEVGCYKGCLNSSDVFILDNGLEIFQWNGKTCNKDEKFKAVQFLQTVKSERGGKPTVESLDEREISDSHKFYCCLKEGEPEDADHEEEHEDFTKCIIRVSDESGSMETTLVSEGRITRDMLDPNDVFLVDTGKELFVWIGSGASQAERQNAIPYAHNYLMKTKHPLVCVTCFKHGSKESKCFCEAFDC